MREDADPLGCVDVVIVEDNDDDARITLRALSKLVPRPTMVVIVDGAAALMQLTGRGAVLPKLVLLDLKLPKVNGLEVLEAIRGCEVARDTVVVVLTSSDEPRDVRRAHELGCNAYITKPVDWSDYVQLVCETASQFLPSASSAA